VKRLWLGLASGLAGFCATVAGAQTPLPATLEGEVSARDSVNGDGRRYDEFQIEAVERQRLTITAEPAPGSALDPVLEVYGPAGASPLVRDNDGGGGRNARVTLSSLANGIYRIRILGATDATGGYRLRIQAGMPRSPLDDPSGVGMTATEPPAGQTGRIELDGPREAFIICPGHRRCPR
jgi:hypothetical protein